MLFQFFFFFTGTHTERKAGINSYEDKEGQACPEDAVEEKIPGKGHRSTVFFADGEIFGTKGQRLGAEGVQQIGEPFFVQILGIALADHIKDQNQHRADEGDDITSEKYGKPIG